METAAASWTDTSRALAVEGGWSGPVTLEIQVDPQVWTQQTPQLLLDMGAGTVRIEGHTVLERNQAWLFNERQRIDVPLSAAMDGVLEVEIHPLPTTHWTLLPSGWVDKIHLGEGHDLDAIELASLREESSESLVWTNTTWLITGLVFLWLWRRRPEPILAWFAGPSILLASIQAVVALELSGVVPAFPGWGPIKSVGASIGAAGIVAFYGRILAPNRPRVFWGLPLILLLSMLLKGVVPDLRGSRAIEATIVAVLIGFAIRNRVREALWVVIPLAFFVADRVVLTAINVRAVGAGWSDVWLAIRPLGNLLTAFSMVMMLAQRLAYNLEAVERFVPREYLSAIGATDLSAVQPGRRVTRIMTVVFTDIRGFTALSETLAPEKMADAVDEVLGVQATEITKCGGFVDKYIGDAVMALFADPADAVRAARACVTRVQELEVEIAIGVGVHTGEVRLGAVGTHDRLACTAMGDTVNVAARIEGLTRVFGSEILLTEVTARAAGLAYRRVDRVVVKGRHEPVLIVEPEPAPEGWEDAFEAWSRGQFADAAEGFAGLQTVLAERCRRLAADPPEEWDGLTRMTTK